MENTLLTADPVELVVQLYQGALRHLAEARCYNANGDPYARGVAISRAIDILSELIFSLDATADGDLCSRLKDLYGYMQHALLDAHARQSDERLAEVADLLATLLEAWRGVAKTEMAEQAAPAPLIATANAFTPAYGAVAV